MFHLKVFDYFSSAHFLKGYHGKCESLHGHNWKVEVEVEGEKLDNVGMLVDFSILKKNLNAVLKEMDHCLLNDMEAFKNNNPSAELISRYIYEKIRGTLPEGVLVSSVAVWESERSQAIYTGE